VGETFDKIDELCMWYRCTAAEERSPEQNFFKPDSDLNDQEKIIKQMLETYPVREILCIHRFYTKYGGKIDS
jgi:hypothetical protein